MTWWSIRGRACAAGDVRLGSRGVRGGRRHGRCRRAPELWLSRPGHAPVRFDFAETLRADAAATLERLRDLGLAVHLLSGDHAAAVAPIAAALGIDAWQAECTPVQKVAAIEALAASGRKVLMVGDGLNDSPSLAAASVSASPASAADISQTVADVVFQGNLLAPVAAVIETARRARTVMRQNLASVDRLQRADGAAGGGGLRHAVACRGGDVEFLAAGDGEQLPAATAGRHERHPLPARREPDPRRRRPGGVPVVAALRPVPTIWKAPPTASCSTTRSGSIALDRSGRRGRDTCEVIVQSSCLGDTEAQSKLAAPPEHVFGGAAPIRCGPASRPRAR